MRYQGEKNLRVIGRLGVGYDNIDVRTASELGIPVVITPGINSNAVAEYTIASMFVAAKGLCESTREMQKGNYAFRFRYNSFELSGKSILLVGCGNIGRLVCKACVALGMTVYVYDKYVSNEDIRGTGAIVCENIEDVLPQVKFISLHIPLNNDTRNIIDEKQIVLMQTGTIIINCARGGLVNEAALIRNLERGKLDAAVLDVFENEPPEPDDPILHAPNVILSPHVAAQTVEAKYQMAVRCIDGMLAVLDGKQWEEVADKTAYNTEK